MEVSKRRAATYGKASRKILVHDLFDVAAAHSNPFRPPTSEPLVPRRTQTPFSDTSEDQETSGQLNQELLSAIRSDYESGTTPKSRSLSPLPVQAPSPALFEIESSEDDTPRSEPVKATYKRRKITPKGSDNEARMTHSKKSAPEAKVDEQQPMHLKPSPMKQVNIRDSQRTQNRKENKVISREANEPRQISDSSGSTTLSNVRNTSPSIGSPRSETSTSSMVSTRSTPKRKRAQGEDIPSDVSSPSQLELSSLKLTPHRRSRSNARRNESEQSDTSNTSSPRAARRLIDRLDSPSSKQSVMDIDAKDASPRPPKLRRTLQDSVPQVSLSRASSEADELSETQTKGEHNSRKELVARKPRTYGKQRSHLKDMVTSASTERQPSSDQSLQDLLTQVDSLKSSQAPLEINDESDDAPDGSQLKSIHELRQAGLANRFDRDVETLLEDIESDNKSLRIQALMQLVRNLQEQAFKRQMLGSGKLFRLTACAEKSLDLPSSVVLLLSLWALTVSEVATAQCIAQIYTAALKLSIILLQETRSIAQIARDRQENLSKTLLREMVDFETHVLEQSVRVEGLEKRSIIPARVMLRCMEHCLRKLIELAQPPPDPSSNVMEQVLTSVHHSLSMLRAEGGEHEHIETLRLLLAWIELTAASSRDIMQSVKPSLIADFGETLAEVISWTKSKQPQLQQSCIRGAVELSNGNLIVCQQFASSKLPAAAFDIVSDHFDHLAKEKTDDLTENSLNAVILSLGLLLNLTDCSEAARASTIMPDQVGVSQISKLTTYFNRHLEETDEAITEEAIQVLIPFGYLSLLLCTLCRDDLVHALVRKLLKEQGVQELGSRAGTFLERMKVVDSDAFVERFSIGVEAVRKGN